MRDCTFCGKIFRSRKSAETHQCNAARELNMPTSIDGFEISEHAFNKFLAVYRKNCKYLSFDDFIVKESPHIERFLSELVEMESPFKVQFCTRVQMVKPLVDSLKEENIAMCTSSMSLCCKNDVKDIIQRYRESTEISIDQFTQRGSGWTLRLVEMVEIRLARYIQDQGGCFRSSLPNQIVIKRACLQLDCHQDCFI